MGLRKDIWRSAVVAAPIADILARGGIAGLPLHWLPPMGSFRFIADPFALWRDGRLTVFVEGYDYRTRRGWIDALVLDERFAVAERGTVLCEPWHLSYPFVFEAEGETWMLPEASRSGQLTLYRAVDFPWRWEAAHRIVLDCVPIDATPLHHAGRWWLFYTSGDREVDKMTALHIAYADRLTGPWTPHPLNPVRVDAGSARPGGSPVVLGNDVWLPVQDCRRTYGGAIRPLRITTLTTEAFAAEVVGAITAPPDCAPFVEGLHTLSAAGPVTLVDMKRTELSLHGIGIQLAREWRRFTSPAAARGSPAR